MSNIPAASFKNIPDYSKPLPYDFKVVDLGVMSQSEFKDVLEQITKIWDKEIAPTILVPKSFKEQFKSDLANSAYRVAAKQLLLATRNCIVQYARKLCSEESKILAITELLDSELGLAMMAMFIGIAASNIPALSSNKKMNRILKEFRISGITEVGNSAVELLLSSVLPIISSAVSDIKELESSNNQEEVDEIILSDIAMDKLVMKQE